MVWLHMHKHLRVVCVYVYVTTFSTLPPWGIKQTAGAGAVTELGSWRQHCRHLPPGSSTSPCSWHQGLYEPGNGTPPWLPPHTTSLPPHTYTWCMCLKCSLFTLFIKTRKHHQILFWKRKRCVRGKNAQLEKVLFAICYAEQIFIIVQDESIHSKSKNGAF